jgi:cytochrome c oxidase subunit 2
MLPRNKLWLVMMSAVLALASSELLAAWDLNMMEGITEISRETYRLHMLIFGICVLIGIGVYGVLIYSLFAYRKSKGAIPATFHHNTKVEMVWTIIPFVILIGMAIPSTRVLTQIYDASESELDILVTGYQWRWQYRYLTEEGEEVSFFSNLTTPDEQIYNVAAKGENYLLEVDEPLVIPVGRKVRFLLTSADVIHSWWVPAFAVKRDAIPGFVNEAWTRIDKPGLYRGQCAELCGKDHGFMPIVVEVKEKADYEKWLGERKAEALQLKELTSKEWTLDELKERGDKVYHTTCVACHQAEGQGLPPMFPALKGSKIATGPKEGHLSIVFHGKPGTSMAAFGKQLSEVDIAAVVTYERNAWGNNKGDMVTPKEVLELKQAESK